jgi:hypothetical protein
MYTWRMDKIQMLYAITTIPGILQFYTRYYQIKHNIIDKHIFF